MNFLTKHMIQDIRELPEPENYFTGHSLDWAGIPQKVLLFSRCRPIDKEPPRVHHRFILVLALEGEGGVMVNERVSMLHPGQGVLIFPFQGHYYTRFRGSRMTWLFVSFELGNVEPLASLRDVLFQWGPAEEELIWKLVEAFRSARRSKTVPRSTLSLWTGLLLMAVQSRIVKRTARAAYSFRHQRTIETMTRHVFQNLKQPIHIRDLAQVTAISASHLQAICRQVLAVGLGEFIRNIRVQRACELLHSSDLNVSQVGEACGFSSLYAFSRTFKQSLRQSPLKYRRSFPQWKTTCKQ